MDYFEAIFVGRVDLDDLATYPDYWKELDVYELWQKAWFRAGKSLFYSQYMGKYRIVCSDSAQEERVGKLCDELAKTRADGVREDTPANRLKLMKWIYRFEDETENQC